MDVFSKLPGEIVVAITRHVLAPYTVSPSITFEVPPPTIQVYARRGHTLRLVNRRFHAAVDCILGVHLHTFPGWQLPVLNIDNGLSHPTLADPTGAHERYWRTCMPHRDLSAHVDPCRTLTVPRLLHLRTLSLDCLPTSLKRKKTDGGDVHSRGLSGASDLLRNMETYSSSLEFLNVRIPAEQSFIDCIGRVIARNVRLRHVVLNIDSIQHCHPRPRPKLFLAHLAYPHLRYRALHTFTIRAPSCDVDFDLPSERQRPFLNRMTSITNFGLICNGVTTNTPNWVFVHTLLRSLPRLHVGDLSIHEHDNFPFPDESALHHHSPWACGDPLDKITLPSLAQLSVQVPEITSHVLQSLDAPELYLLRLRSSVDISIWPDCKPNHFPSLFVVNIICPGPSAIRLDVLGVVHENAVHNYSPGHSLYHANSNDFLAYLKPYRRERHLHRPRPTCSGPFRAQSIPTIRPWTGRLPF